MKTIAVALQKGGSAKTTTAVNIAACMGAKKKRVLLIDMDAQANATFYSGINSKTIESSLYNVITSSELHKNLSESIQHTKYYDIIPADIDVADLVNELKDVSVLKNILAQISNNYDYVILDTPPALNAITVTAFVASDYLLIPTEAKPFNFAGLEDLKDTIDELKKRGLNKNLSVLGILLIKYSNRTNLSRVMADLIEKKAKLLSTTILNTTIRESIVVPESQIAKQPLIDYAPNAKPTLDFKSSTAEILKILEDKKDVRKKK